LLRHLKICEWHEFTRIVNANVGTSRRGVLRMRAAKMTRARRALNTVGKEIQNAIQKRKKKGERDSDYEQRKPEGLISACSRDSSRPGRPGQINIKHTTANKTRWWDKMRRGKANGSGIRVQIKCHYQHHCHVMMCAHKREIKRILCAQNVQNSDIDQHVHRQACS
jgi:type II secretory pathway component PulJ